MQILQSFEVHPLDQTIRYDGAILDSQGATLGECGVLAGSTLHVSADDKYEVGGADIAALLADCPFAPNTRYLL